MADARKKFNLQLPKTSSSGTNVLDLLGLSPQQRNSIAEDKQETLLQLLKGLCNAIDEIVTW